jgi:hypothetical protein
MNYSDNSNRIQSSQGQIMDPPLIKPRSSNTDGDKFLFYFTPEDIAVDCCCGCSLKTGVQIIAIIFIFGALSNLFAALRMTSYIDLIVTTLSFFLYFAAGVCVLYSSMTFNFVYAYTGYFIYAIIFLISLLDNIIVLLLIFSDMYKPLGNEPPFKTGLIFLSAILITVSINLYMVWIIFSYSVHLKHKRISLISGYIFYQPENMQPRVTSAV